MQQNLYRLAYMALHPVELPMHLFVKLNLNTLEHEIIFKVNFKDFSVWMGKPSLDLAANLESIGLGFMIDFKA
jgi:hypothetical protein